MIIQFVFKIRITGAIFLIISLASCDPRANIFDPAPVLINAQIINPRDSIYIGDTIKVYLEIPDTIVYNGKHFATFIGNDDGGNIGITLYKINKSHAGAIGPPDSSVNFASIGSYNQYDVVTFQKISNKLEALVNFIPGKKGVYFLDVTEYGYLVINNKSLNVRFNFNYGSINRNHQMLIDSAGSAANFNLYLQDHAQQGLEVYGFNVK